MFYQQPGCLRHPVHLYGEKLRIVRVWQAAHVKVVR